MELVKTRTPVKFKAIEVDLWCAGIGVPNYKHWRQLIAADMCEHIITFFREIVDFDDVVWKTPRRTPEPTAIREDDDELLASVVGAWHAGPWPDDRPGPYGPTELRPFWGEIVVPYDRTWRQHAAADFCVRAIDYLRLAAASEIGRWPQDGLRNARSPEQLVADVLREWKRRSWPSDLPSK